MFLREKQNKQTNRCVNSPNQLLMNYHRQHVRQQKDKKLTNLRQIYTSEVINWKQPLPNFIQTLNQNHNLYSLLITLFQISEDPFWRNKVHHLCILIQKLHNYCVQKNGNYLSEMTNIPDYENRLCRLFYLNDNTLQEHFKLLITLYLFYNANLRILDQSAIAIGIIHAGRYRSDNKLAQYLWLISQFQIRREPITRILKVIFDVLQRKQQNSQFTLQALLPTLTILSNYIYVESDQFVLDQLVENTYFQAIFMFGLKQKERMEIFREALLLCNNLLSKSRFLALKIMSSAAVMEVASLIECEEQLIFQQLIKLRREQYDNLV